MIGFVADTHLHPYAWNSLPQVCGDAYDSWGQVVKGCIERKLKLLILGGDIFDAHPPADAVCVFLDGIRALKEAGIEVLAIQGQHGYSRTVPWTSINNDVIWLHKTIHHCGPLVISGFDTQTPDELKAELERLSPEVNVLVLHQMMRGCVPEIAGTQNWDFDPAWVPPTVRLVLMGDFHQALVRVQPATEQTFVYNGSTCMQSIDEPPDKFWTLVDERTFAFTRVLLATRPFHEVRIFNAEALDQAVATVSQLAPETLCVVRYSSDVEGVDSRLLKANKAVHYMFRPLVEAHIVAVEGAPVAGALSLETCLGQAVDVQAQPELHNFILKLLRSDQPRDVIEAARVVFLEGASQ